MFALEKKFSEMSSNAQKTARQVEEEILFAFLLVVAENAGPPYLLNPQGTSREGPCLF